MKPTDISYYNDGTFTRFLPLTEAGENAWRKIAEVAECAAIPMNQEKYFVKSLRAAGYVVRKRVVTVVDDAGLLAELGL